MSKPVHGRRAPILLSIPLLGLLCGCNPYSEEVTVLGQMVVSILAWGGLAAGGIYWWFHRKRLASGLDIKALLRGDLDKTPPVLFETEDYQVLVALDRGALPGSIRSLDYLVVDKPSSDSRQTKGDAFPHIEQRAIEHRLDIWRLPCAEWRTVLLTESDLLVSSAHPLPIGERAWRRRLKHDTPKLQRLLWLLLTNPYPPSIIAIPEAQFIPPDTQSQLLVDAVRAHKPAEIQQYLATTKDQMLRDYVYCLRLYAGLPMEDPEIAGLLYHPHLALSSFAREQLNNGAFQQHHTLRYGMAVPALQMMCLTHLKQSNDLPSVPHLIAWYETVKPGPHMLELLMRKNDGRVLGFFHQVLEHGSHFEKNKVAHCLADIGNRDSLHLLRKAAKNHPILFAAQMRGITDKIENRHPRDEHAGSISVVSPGEGAGMLTPAEVGNDLTHIGPEDAPE